MLRESTGHAGSSRRSDTRYNDYGESHVPDNTTPASPIEQACLDAMNLYIPGCATLANIRTAHIADDMAVQLDERKFGVPSLPLPEDLQAFVLALMGWRTIAMSETNYDRQGAARLLREAADRLDDYEYLDPDDLLPETPKQIRHRLDGYFSKRSPQLDTRISEVEELLNDVLDEAPPPDIPPVA